MSHEKTAEDMECRYRTCFTAGDMADAQAKAFQEGFTYAAEFLTRQSLEIQK